MENSRKKTRTDEGLTQNQLENEMKTKEQQIINQNSKITRLKTKARNALSLKEKLQIKEEVKLLEAELRQTKLNWFEQ